MVTVPETIIPPDAPMTSAAVAARQGVAPAEVTRLAKNVPDGVVTHIGDGRFLKVTTLDNRDAWIYEGPANSTDIIAGEVKATKATTAKATKTKTTSTTSTTSTTTPAAMPDIHPLCLIWPTMDEVDYAGLKASISAIGGLLHPIVMIGDQILDGRHRYRACIELGIEPRTVQFDGPDPMAFVAAQHARRNLTTGQRSAIAAEMATRMLGDNQHSEGSRIRPPSIAEAARLTGVGQTSVKAAKAVMAAAPELHEAVKAGTITLEKAATKVRASKAEARKAEQGVARHQKQLDGDAGLLPSDEQAAHDRRRMAEVVAEKARALATVHAMPMRLIAMAREFDQALAVLGAEGRAAVDSAVLIGIASAVASFDAAARKASSSDVIDQDFVEASPPALPGTTSRH